MENIILKLNKLKKLKTMPPKQIMNKIEEKFKKRVYYFYRKLKRTINGVELHDSYFANFEPQCMFFNNLEENGIHKFSSHYYPSIEIILPSLNNILSHKFNLLGCKDKYVGEKLPWNEDYITGYKWKNKFYKDIKTVNLFNNADVKVPWELSRFQHLITLGNAYLLTKNESYSLEFMNQIEDWIEKNPVEMSVNWTCTMDVAIRAVNWIYAYFLFKNSENINKKFWTQFNKMLYLHGRFIINNLEKGKYTEYANNHYISDIVGLIWLGIYFGDFIVADKYIDNNPRLWLSFGLKEIENEMKIEVNEDGTSYEGSTSYHRLVTELFLYTTVFCYINNIFFSQNYMCKIEKMCDFIMNITKPNGLAPVIGDADDGRLLILSNYSSWNRRDFRNLLAIAGEFFNRDDFRYSGEKYKQDALLIMSKFKAINNLEVELSSKAYKNGGYYILRNNRVYCVVRCGELCMRGQGGHSHNEQLSLELNVDGEDFIVDPGTYVYTADYKMRNLFRSTCMHNTLFIEDYEQNDFNKYDLFSMKEQTFAKCELFEDNTFLGEHFGYEKKCAVVHQRSIKLVDGKLIITDKLKNQQFKNDSIKAYINFTLDYGVKIEKKTDGIELFKNNKKIFIKLNNTCFIKKSYISYGYGQKIDTDKILIEVKDNISEIEIFYK